MGTVAWEFRYPESDPAAWTPMPGALFQPGAVYRAVVTLYAAAGYTLQDAAFFHDGGEINESGTAGASLLKELKIAFPATEKLPVADLDLTSKVPLPMPGESPVSSFASLEYTGDVVWTDEDSEEPVEGFFKAETVYSAEVNLTVTSGYTFNGAAAPAAAVSRSVTTAYIGFTHGEGETVDAAVMGDDSARVKIAFPKTASAPPEPVTDLILTSKVPAPVADKLPVWYFTVPQYTGLVEWYPEPSSGGFTVNRPYRAQVTLKAAPGWTFKGMEGPFVHGGADPAPALQPNPDTTVDNPGVTATITIAFPPATEPPFQWGISDNDLTNKVFRPEARATPATWVETQEYGGWVEWYTTGDHTPHTGSFGSGVAYTAEIRLMSSSGNTFYDNDGSLTPFTHTGVSYEPKDISTSVRQIILIIIDFEETK
jgi:hypothetical protein